MHSAKIEIHRVFKTLHGKWRQKERELRTRRLQKSRIESRNVLGELPGIQEGGGKRRASQAQLNTAVIYCSFAVWAAAFSFARAPLRESNMA